MSWNPPNMTTPPPAEQPEPTPAPETQPAPAETPAPAPAPAPEPAPAPAPVETPPPSLQAAPDAASTPSATPAEAAPAGPNTHTVSAEEAAAGLEALAEKLDCDAAALAYFHGQGPLKEGEEVRVPASEDFTVVPADAGDLFQLHGEDTLKVFALNYGRWQPNSPHYLSHPDHVEGGWVLEIPR